MSIIQEEVNIDTILNKLLDKQCKLKLKQGLPKRFRKEKSGRFVSRPAKFF